MSHGQKYCVRFREGLIARGKEGVSRLFALIRALVAQFTEKPQIGEGWINGGYLVFEPGIFRYLSDDGCSLEADALEQMASDKQLAAYRHEGFWQCMDTLREKRLLENIWQSGHVPWRIWD
jgi:glucose-1-phosphate cytidylyltransferase